MREAIAEILHGIDQVNTDDATPWGWWSDTLAAEFGAVKLAQIQELFDEHVSEETEITEEAIKSIFFTLEEEHVSNKILTESKKTILPLLGPKR